MGWSRERGRCRNYSSNFCRFGKKYHIVLYLANIITELIAEFVGQRISGVFQVSYIMEKNS